MGNGWMGTEWKGKIDKLKIRENIHISTAIKHLAPVWVQYLPSFSSCLLGNLIP